MIVLSFNRAVVKLQQEPEPDPDYGLYIQAEKAFRLKILRKIIVVIKVRSKIVLKLIVIVIN